MNRLFTIALVNQTRDLGKDNGRQQGNGNLGENLAGLSVQILAIRLALEDIRPRFRSPAI